MSNKFQFVDLKQNTLPYIAVMRFGAWLLIFLRKEQMQMKLVLAEKPSVAQSIAKVLGVAKREDGYQAKSFTASFVLCSDRSEQISIIGL